MKKLIIISIIAFLAIGSSNAQFFVEFNNGYAKAINAEKDFNNPDSYTNKDYYNLDSSNYNQYNLAQGFFIEPRVGYKINNWLSASVGFYYFADRNFINISYSNEHIDVFIVDSTSTYARFSVYNYVNHYTLKTQYAIIPEISINKQIHKFDIKLNLGLSLSNTLINYNIDTLETKYTSGASTSGGSGYYKNIITNKYKTSLSQEINMSIRLGLEFSYTVSSNISVLGKIYYSNLVFSPTKQITYYKYNNSYYIQDDGIDIITGGHQTTIDETTKEEETKGDLFGMNTLQFSFGIRYTFGKKEK